VAELEKKEHTVVGETVGDLGDGDRGEAGVGASVTSDVQDDAEEGSEGCHELGDERVGRGWRLAEEVKTIGGHGFVERMSGRYGEAVYDDSDVDDELGVGQL
jgi:hypothetical protein